jgi:hypothetical protein
MKINNSVPFSLTEQTKQKADHKQQVKIELLICQRGGYNCKEHLSLINEYYVEADNYHFDKDYLNSIESLKCAFFKTIDLNQDSCVNCAKLFRSTITQSLENINGELKNLTSGLLSKKRYHKSYMASCDVLNEIKQSE